MPESILDSTKKVLGIDAAYTAFDIDVIMHINSVFSTLQQLGIGANHEESFAISGKDETWEDFIGTEKNVNAVKSYMYLRVRILFDPPATSFALDSMKQQITELEWRLNVQMEAVRHPSSNTPVIPQPPTGPDTGSGGVDSYWSNVFKYRAKTNALVGDPGNGKFQWLDLDQISSTHIDISNITDDSLNIATGLADLSVGDTLYVQDWSIAYDFQEWLVTSVAQQPAYCSLEVQYVTSGGKGTTNFASNLILAVRFKIKK